MFTLIQDIKYGFRKLLKSPGFTVVAVLTLALGIGANTTIFSVVNAVLIKPLPFRDPDQLVRLSTIDSDGNSGPASYPDFEDWRRQARSFEYLAAYTPQSSDFIAGGEPERLHGVCVSQSFFPLLGVNACIGRTFHEGEDRPDAGRAIILSDRIWKRHFGEDTNILGQTVRLDDVGYTVVGVLPCDYDYPLLKGADFWIPLTERRPRYNYSYDVLGRLKHGVTQAQAAEEMTIIATRIAREYPESHNNFAGVKLESLSSYIVGDMHLYLLVLQGAIAFVLLIACANVANLVLARATTREKEIAVCKALGASTFRVARQMLTESLLLALTGGAIGVFLVLYAIDILRPHLAWIVPRADEIDIDFWVLGMAFLTSMITGLFFGIVPVVRLSRSMPCVSLVERWTLSRARSRLSNILVVLEFSAAFVLLVGAGLMTRTFQKLATVDPGFNSARLLTFKVSLPPLRYTNESQCLVFCQQALARLTDLRGVKDAAMNVTMPFGGSYSAWNVTVYGRPESGQPNLDASIHSVSFDYFRTLGIPLLSGRTFNRQDIVRRSKLVIINEKLAQICWPNENPLGQRLNVGREAPDGSRVAYEVIGVVGNTLQSELTQELEPSVYFAYSVPFFDRDLGFIVRTEANPEGLVPDVRNIIRELDPSLPILRTGTMQQSIADSISRQRFSLIFFGLFAVLAVILVIVGIYGVVSYVISQRIHEIGIRMALGARRQNILVMILKRGLMLSLAGSAIGLAGSFGLTRFLRAYLYQISPVDPITFAIVPLLITGVVMLACYFPARRAAKIDPIKALRYE
jgi:putative ABC transport system permease protein